MRIFLIILYAVVSFMLITNAYNSEILIGNHSQINVVINKDAEKILAEQWFPVLAIATILLFILGYTIKNMKNKKTVLNRE